MSQQDFPSETLPASEDEASARYKFLILFAEPFRILDERGDGHGACVALSLGLFLCERYFRQKSDSVDVWREERFLTEAAKHFQVDQNLFSEFWSVYRHGTLFQGAPKATDKYGWDMSEDYPAMPTKFLQNGKAVIQLNPWEFTAEMIALCWYDPVALTRICNFPLGIVSKVPSTRN